MWSSLSCPPEAVALGPGPWPLHLQGLSVGVQTYQLRRWMLKPTQQNYYDGPSVWEATLTRWKAIWSLTGLGSKPCPYAH